MLTFKVRPFPVRTFTTVLDNYQDSAFNSYITDPPLCFPSVVLFWMQTASPRNIQLLHCQWQVSQLSGAEGLKQRYVQYFIWWPSFVTLFCSSAVSVGSWLSKLCQQEVATRRCQI